MKILPVKPDLEHQDQEQVQEEGLHITLYLSYSHYFYEMTDRIKNKKDEYDIDFEYAALD
jgi:hypothetical protein